MDYASPAEVLVAIETLDADVAARLQAIAAAQPAAAAFAASASASRTRRASERARLAARLRVPPPAPAPASAGTAPGLRGLREAQQALVHAHAEGLPALADAEAVDLLARHMVELAGQLTVLDLWIEDEERRAGE